MATQAGPGPRVPKTDRGPSRDDRAPGHGPRRLKAATGSQTLRRRPPSTVTVAHSGSGWHRAGDWQRPVAGRGA